MAKDKYNELKHLKHQPNEKRGEAYNVFRHHEHMVTNKLGGRNLYLDEAERNALIDKAIALHTHSKDGQPHIDTAAVLKAVLPAKLLHPETPESRFVEGDSRPTSSPLSPRYQRGAVREFKKEHQLEELVSQDLKVRNHAWKTLTVILDRHERDGYPEHFR